MPGRAAGLAIVLALIASCHLCAQEAVDGALVSDITVHAEDGNSYVIFYDMAGNECITSGVVAVYKRVTRMRDRVKIQGSGINQQFVLERVPYDDYGLAAQKRFSSGDFKEIMTSRGRKITVLPLSIPLLRRGESVRVVFGMIEKTVTAGY